MPDQGWVKFSDQVPEFPCFLEVRSGYGTLTKLYAVKENGERGQVFFGTTPNHRDADTIHDLGQYFWHRPQFRSKSDLTEWRYLDHDEVEDMKDNLFEFYRPYPEKWRLGDSRPKRPTIK